MKTAEQNFKECCKTFAAMRDTDKRKAAMREFLQQSNSIDFNADVHAIPSSGLVACATMAKAIKYKKSPASSLSLGAAFFCYLARDLQHGRAVGQRAEIAAVPVTTKRGKRWNNDGIAK